MEDILQFAKKAMVYFLYNYNIFVSKNCFILVFIFKAPGPFSGQYNGFIMERVFHGAFDETTCLDWSYDSKVLCVGSKDMSVKLYPLDK